MWPSFHGLSLDPWPSGVCTDVARQLFRLARVVARVVILAVMTGFGPAAAHSAEPGKFWVFVGTYTDHESKGIYRMVLDTAIGQALGAGARRRAIQPFVPGDSSDGKIPVHRE